MSKKSFVQQFYTKLVDRDGNNCHYCEKPLIPLQSSKGNPLYFEPLFDVDPTTGVMTVIGYTPKKEYGEATVDHIQLKSEGGSNELENLVLACWECNTERNVKPYDEFLRLKRGVS